ncbi:MAG: serine protease, partial [Candidatus Nanopelagicales bacterium]|nr:serine protease [Candidatus Nanopelagicales bacterium]
GSNRSSVIINPSTTRLGTRHWIDQVVVHPSYRPGASTHRNDIALIHSPSEIGATTLPLNFDAGQPTSGVTEYVYGFGSIGSGRQQSSVLLRGTVMDLSGPDSGVCGTYGSVYDPAVQLCAGLPGGGVDACQGDSGGPLTASLGGETRLVGIVSEGIGCAEAAFPGLYTRVSSFATWVASTITPRPRWKMIPNPRKRLVAHRGKKLQVTLRNRGTARGAWQATAGAGLKPILRQGSVRPRKKKVIKFRPTTRRCLVTHIELQLANKSPVRYRVKLNPRRCGK